MPYLPQFTYTVRRWTGSNGTPPNTILYSGEPAAVWFSKGRSRDTLPAGYPIITAQVALAESRLAVTPGWGGNPPVFDYSKADYFQIFPAQPVTFYLAIVAGGPMWHGTPQAHCRYDCTPAASVSGVPVTAFPTGRTDGYTTTFDVYRPFGAATPVTAGLVGVFYSDYIPGRGGYSGGNYLMHSDFLDVASTVDVRDGVSRAAGLDTLSFANGDEVRVPSGASASRYVVTRVSNMRDLNGTMFKRVYLLRDQIRWPGP